MTGRVDLESTKSARRAVVHPCDISRSYIIHSFQHHRAVGTLSGVVHSFVIYPKPLSRQNHHSRSHVILMVPLTMETTCALSYANSWLMVVAVTTDINEKGELSQSKAKVSLTRMIDENASSETNVQCNWCFKKSRLCTNFCLCDEKFGRQIDVQEKNVKTISNHWSNPRMIVERKRN